MENNEFNCRILKAKVNTANAIIQKIDKKYYVLERNLRWENGGKESSWKYKILVQILV